MDLSEKRNPRCDDCREETIIENSGFYSENPFYYCQKCKHETTRFGDPILTEHQKKQRKKMVVESLPDMSYDDYLNANDVFEYKPLNYHGLKAYRHKNDPDGLWGLMSTRGVKQTVCKYQEIQKFNLVGTTVVKRGNKFGVMNWAGQEVIPVEYDTLYENRTGEYTGRKDRLHSWELLIP